MIVKQKQARLLFSFVALLLILSLTMAGCGSTPTPKPQPTFALEVSPGAEVQVGKDVAIVAKVEPLEKLDLEWSVSGTAGGKLNTDIGEQVIYTAGKEGTDIVVAEGTTASGVPVKQTVSLTVVGEPVAQAPTSADTPLPPTDTSSPPLETPKPPPCQSTRPSLDGPPVNVEVQITSPGHCDTGLPTTTTAGGTYSGDLTGKEIWILVYPPDLKYYPQSLGACEGLPVDASGGIWNTTVHFGGPLQQFDVVAVVTDTDGEASQEFKRWLQRGCETNDFPGYPRNKLPGGITEVDAITVSTAGG